MSADEEGGIFTALQRLEAARRVDMHRVMVLRVATDIDRGVPRADRRRIVSGIAGPAPFFGFVGLDNIYRVGSPVVREIAVRDRWQDGPPPLPNSGHQ